MHELRVQADLRRITRRHLLQAGAIGTAGLSLPGLLAAENVAPGRKARARSCILFFLEGGPSHIDLWDMKPDAPSDIRGEFAPIATSAGGLQLCEYLPRLARQMHHVAAVRSVHHKVIDHNAGAYYCLTGRAPFRGEQLILGPASDNFPPFGAVAASLMPNEGPLPPFVHLSEIMSNNGQDLPGQHAGFLGPACDPFVLGDVSVPGYRVPGLQLREEVSEQRVQRRRRLLATVTGLAGHAGPQADDLDAYQQKAFDLLLSPRVRAAFDLDQEPAEMRRFYGLPDRDDRRDAREFGGLPHLGQCMLMARRLIEGGARLVTLGTGRRYCQAWDTHRTHFQLLKTSLLPYVDRAFAALLADLDQRGLLKETLVVAMGEFGRTPKIGQVTSPAGADANGRDHWPHCNTVLFAGAGIRGGTAYGSSDAHAAYPRDNPVTPEDIAATIYYALGIEPAHELHDTLGRPHPVSLGKPILDLF